MARIRGKKGDDELVGTPGRDTILGRGGNDLLDGLGGRNTLNGGPGDDVFRHDGRDEGISVIVDSGGADALRAIDTPKRDSGNFEATGEGLIWTPFDGQSRITIPFDDDGRPVVEVLEWERYEDEAAGITPYLVRLDIVTDASEIGTSNFAFAGTSSRDVVTIGATPDLGGSFSEIYLGGGNDKATIRNPEGNYILVYGGDGRDTILGRGDGFEDVRAGNGADRIMAAGGDDRLYGERGNDRIKAGAGDDLIVGGAGKDRLTGGKGEDTFRFETGERGRDTITDFTLGVDLIDVDGGFAATRVRDRGDDALLLFGGGQSALLKNVDHDAIDESTFGEVPVLLG